MSPIEYIAKGIREGNWEIVCEGYERLTGKALPIPKTVATIDEAENALRQIANIASSALNGPMGENCDEKTKPANKKLGRPKVSVNKKKIKKKTTITQNGEDPSIQLDDNNKTVTQKKVGETQLITNDPDPKEVKRNRVRAEKSKKNKLKLNRQPMKTHKVKCNECEKTFESNRPDGEMGQKCQDCLRNKKSKFAK